MKLNFFTLSALGYLAVVSAADTTVQATATDSAEVTCQKSCDATDACCIAKCYSVPCPNETQVNDTNQCVAACPQGTGGVVDNSKYSDCEQSCVSSHYLNGATATAASVTSTASATSATSTNTTDATGVTGVTVLAITTTSTGISTTATETSFATSAATSSSSSSTSTSTNAAVHVSVSGAGLFGLLLAAFAL